jgi:hypothetical protein
MGWFDQQEEPKTISYPLCGIQLYSDLQWMLLKIEKPVTIVNRFLEI